LRRLVSSSEAAEILGLSLQGIHYRIKKGQLKSMKKDGKTYVYVEKEQVDEFHNKDHQVPQPTQNTNTTQQVNSQVTNTEARVQQELPEQHKKLYELVYKAKDDQIKDLKENIEAVKEQYKTEIYRLDKNQKQILEVFQSEVELLKSAFHEMKNVYHLEHKERMEDKKHMYEQKETTPKQEEVLENEEPKKAEQEIEIPFMDIKEFYAYMKDFNKTDAQIKNIILERIKVGDKRFIYKKGTKEVIIFKSDFMDLV